MIDQGTDSLSREIWMSTLHTTMDERTMLSAIFAPTIFDASLMQLICKFLPDASSTYNYYHWRSPWVESDCFGRLTVWCPPPELCCQVITFILNMWIEQPHTTSALIILPRTCAASYLGLSKYLRHVGTISPLNTSLKFPPILPISIEVLYLAPCTPCLVSSSRLVPLSYPNSKWHQTQAETMHQLLPVPIR